MSLIMNAIDLSRLRKLDLLDEATGQLRLLTAKDYDSLPRDSVRMWCWQNARYGLPTLETVAWLKAFIAGREAIEIGSGAGDLAFFLGIRGTDSKHQNDPESKRLYEATGQPTIKYPEWVEKIDAVEAVKKYKPEVVVAQWVTHWIDPNLPPPPGGGCMVGIKEEEILATGATYVVIGNTMVHKYKPLLKLPHEEIKLPFLRSRASYPEEDVVYIWHGSKAPSETL